MTPDAHDGVAPAEPSRRAESLLGSTLDGRYRVLAFIARGGMGKIYKAEQVALGRMCAIKVLDARETGASDPEFQSRFFQEAAVAAKLRHANTVRLFDFGRTSDGIYYMVMELLEGETLQQYIARQKPLSSRRAIAIVRQIARSLREAHQHNVVHRDLKPANVFLVRHGEDREFVKVLDFGLVKVTAEGTETLTKTGLVPGTPNYMAPEQIRGDKVTPRADIYSLGILMYQLLTGRAPFDGGAAVDILRRHLTQAVPEMQARTTDGDISPALREIVHRCLEKDPDARYASMDELIAALDEAARLRSGGSDSASGQPSLTPTSIASEVAASGRRERRQWRTVRLVAVSLLAVAVTSGGWHALDPRGAYRTTLHAMPSVHTVVARVPLAPMPPVVVQVPVATPAATPASTSATDTDAGVSQPSSLPSGPAHSHHGHHTHTSPSWREGW